MDSSADTVIARFVALDPRLPFAFNPPVAPERLAAAEAELGAALPDDVRALYLRHDGQPDDAPGIFTGPTWLPARRSASNRARSRSATRRSAGFP
jgi:cell wall assembly regulator SMI1